MASIASYFCSSAVAGGSSTSAVTAATATGSHVIQIKSYTESLGCRTGTYITSSKFLAAGHVWFISYYPHGCNEETADCISFFLNLDGRYEVMARFRISLVDPEGNLVSRIYTRVPIIFNETSKQGWGFQRFIEREVFEKSNCLEDNCFSIVCDIAVINGFHKQEARKFVGAVPPSDLHQDLGRLLVSGEGADVKFKVGENVLLAHKNIVASRSSVFMAELFGPLKDEAKGFVQIHDMLPEVFWAMLYFMYTDSVPEMPAGDEIVMTQHLLVAADRYDLHRLKLICEDKLSCRITKKTAATTLVLAEQHGCDGLKEACFAFLSSLGNLKAVMDTDGYDHLRSCCPSLHDELVAKIDVSKTVFWNSIWEKTRSQPKWTKLCKFLMNFGLISMNFGMLKYYFPFGSIGNGLNLPKFSLFQSNPRNLLQKKQE